jgi:hypothetical protein
MRVHVTDLNDEWADSIVISISFVLDKKSSKDKGMVGISSHFSRPPLGSGVGWGVDHKLICIFIKGSGGLKPSNI